MDNTSDTDFTLVIKDSVARKQIVTDIEVWNRESELSSIAKGIWDTGAKMSSITRSLADALLMFPIPGKNMRVSTSNGIKVTELYSGTLILGDYEEDVVFTACDELIDGISVVIGMDIISRGDFSITNVGGKTEFIFRLPTKGHIGSGQTSPHK